MDNAGPTDASAATSCAKTMRFGLFVPTLNAGPSWPAWLAALAQQTRQPDRVLIVDSSSQDQTVALAQAAGHECRIIARSEFNHGTTRQLAVDALSDCDVVICMTQDALLAGPTALEKLLAAFAQPAVAIAYGRQLPHLNATPLAAHAREFNYPAESYTVSLADKDKRGLKTAFCSNSFAAWRRKPLLECGGFPCDVLLAEDMVACARLLSAGWSAAYVAEATSRHSHNYNAIAEFRRYFDTGVLHQQETWLISTFGKAEGEGLRFVRSEWAAMQAVGLGWQLRGLIRNSAKWLGYRAGRSSPLIPRKMCRAMSMHPNWW